MPNTEILDKLVDAIVKGKIKEAKPLAEQALAAGFDPSVIIFDSLNKAMETVGQRYVSKNYFLPQVLLSAQTLYQALDVVLPRLKVDQKVNATGKVVLAVVEGDVHDIGKNIVKAMWTGAGIIITDMGRDVPIKNIIEKVKADGATVIATSTLMTTTLSGMKEIENLLKKENLKGKIKTIIGGGATSEEYAAQIGADSWARNAMDAVKKIEILLK
jgi:corrinoid protein of di/trimethylamine methyltransferase